MRQARVWFLIGLIGAINIVAGFATVATAEADERTNGVKDATAVSVTVGSEHACALTGDEQAICWGVAS